MTSTWARARRVATIAVGIAALALPALAAGGIGTGSGDAVPVTYGTVAGAPAAGGAPASHAAAAAATTTSAAATAATGSEGAASASDDAGTSAAADESGSTETRKVQRSCGAPRDPHYVPSSGRDAGACYDATGTFRPGRTYTATHYTNDVTCGSKNVLVPVDAAGAYVSANGDGGADGGSGYVQACSDDALPINGRATARGDVDASGDFTASATADGDKDNPDETSQGWATATVSPDGPAYRCGKTYAEGGRADSDSPTSEDTADECG